MVAREDFKESFEGTKASEEVVPHSQGDVDYWVYTVLLGTGRWSWDCQEWDHGLLRKIYNGLSDFVN